MTTKTITITEDAYESVAGLKQGEESFSDLFLRLGKKHCTAHDLIGAIDSDKGFAKRVHEAHEQLGNGLKKRKNYVRARFQCAD